MTCRPRDSHPSSSAAHQTRPRTSHIHTYTPALDSPSQPDPSHPDSIRRPPSTPSSTRPALRSTVQVAPVAATATSSRCWATPIPTDLSACGAVRHPPAALTVRPVLRIRARVDGPGNCSGSGSAPGSGRSCSSTVSWDPEVIALSRPVNAVLGQSKDPETDEGSSGQPPPGYAKVSEGQVGELWPGLRAPARLAPKAARPPKSLPLQPGGPGRLESSVKGPG